MEIVMNLEEGREPYNTHLILTQGLYNFFLLVYETEILLGEVKEIEEGWFDIKINLMDSKFNVLLNAIKINTMDSQSFLPLNLN